MTNDPQPAPQTVTPERQAAATQISQVFNSVHAYITTLQYTNAEGQKLTTQPLEYARKSIEEAAFWAIKHVLQHGVAPAPKPQPEAPANDGATVPGPTEVPSTPLPTVDGGTPSEST